MGSRPSVGLRLVEPGGALAQGRIGGQTHEISLATTSKPAAAGTRHRDHARVLL
jgi:hypothetical protein